MSKNFLLIELFDNDFGDAMRDAAEHALHNLDCKVVSDIKLKPVIVQHMIGTCLQRSSSYDPAIDWNGFKSTAEYLDKNIKVSVVEKVPSDIDYNGGGAYADLNTGDVFIL